MPGITAAPDGPLSMRARVEHWREQQRTKQGQSSTTRRHISEDVLLRDAVLILQGIDGKHVRFQDATAPQTASNRKGKQRLPVIPLEREEDDTEGSPDGGLVFIEEEHDLVIPQATKHLLHRLSEIGWLYRQIQRGILAKLSDPSAGMVEMSLCHCLQEHLREYDELISELESRRTLYTRPEGETPSTSKTLDLDLNSPELGLTLNRLIVWTERHRLSMRMMGVLTAGYSNTRGGALLSLLHSFTSHGDPFISSFCTSLLSRVSEPFFASLASWIYQGELVDPGSEFFVQRRSGADPDESERRTEADGEGQTKKQTWSGRYRFRKEMLPSFVGEEFGRKIFSTGRSLNYIKYACSDSSWVSLQRQRTPTPTASAVSDIRASTQQKKTSTTTLKYDDIAGLEHSIDTAYAAASQRLFEIFFDKFGLLRHLKAIKDYLLLSRGDFVDCLMENLGPSLAKPANTLYRHNLTATLETAIRSTSSSADHPDVLRRLDARMLDFTHGEVGWEVFTLEYKVDPPVDVVLDADAMDVYTKLFTHLWKIKRCEYALNDAWKKVTNGARWWRKVSDLQPDFHTVRLALSEMLHFTRQLQHFCHLEVIDCSWKKLEDFALRKEGDLDGLIDAHREYIERLATKALLRGTGAKQDDSILLQVREAFRVILQFKETVDALCSYALAEASRLDSEQNGQRGLVPSSSSRSSTPLPPLPPADPEQLASLRRRVARYSSQFHETVVGIATSLAGHSDLDLRFLSVRINFSLFYLVGKREKK